MNAYVDLSYIFHLLILLTLPYYCKRILNIVMKKVEVISLGFFSLVLYFNVFIFASYPYLNYIFIFIYFFVLYRKKVFKYFLVYLLVYYSNVATMMIFTNDIYLLNGLVFLNSEIGFFYILFELMNIVIIELIFLSIRSIKLFKNYKTKIRIKIDGDYVEVEGYIDSGNTLLVEGLPVIFLSENYFIDRQYKEMIVNGIGVRRCKYFKTKVEINNKESEVICASGDKRGYKGCQCLINIHLMEENNDEIIK